MSQTRPNIYCPSHQNLARKPAFIESIEPDEKVKAFTPKVVKKPKRPVRPIKRVNGWQLFFSTLIWVTILYQSMMQSTELINIHYEVEQLQLASNKLKQDNLAQYQLVSEMTNQDRLLNVLKDAGLNPTGRTAFSLQ